MKTQLNKIILTLAALALFTGSRLWSQGATISIEPARDNTVFSEAAESNAKGLYLFAGRTNASSLRRTLLQFDVAGALPAGAVIESATLTLRMNKSIVGGQAIAVHLLQQDWGEGTSDAADQEGKGAPATTGDATWLNAFHPSTPWSKAGGDFAPTASATTVVGGTGFHSWNGSLMAADVQRWIDDPASNFGWILVGPENAASAKRFDSREATVAANRPKLTLTYSVPAATWAGYPIHTDKRSVDTGAWIGWIDIGDEPWIYSYGLNKYIYAPVQNVGPGGGWLWIRQ